VSTDPLLGTLQDNGGLTFTHALLPSSQAINGGDNSGCPSTDQRGVPRPQGAACDIGAYELILDSASDLGVTKVDALGPVTVGDNITYTVTVSNSGPDTTQNVTLTDTLPGSTTYVSATLGQDSCDEVGGVVTCSLGDILNGGTTSVEIVVTTTAAGTLTNSASVAADTADPNPNNNSTEEQTTVDTLPDQLADLGVTIMDALDPVTVGDKITYTATVSNSGPDTAPNVILTDSLPDGVVFGSAVPDQGGCNNNSGLVTCHLGSLSSSGQLKIEIVVTSTSSGTITNHAGVSANSSDRDLQNNSASETTTVDPTEYLIYLPITSHTSN
jgi:uncharacterized repeat protein (TIGR01451 family)